MTRYASSVRNLPVRGTVSCLVANWNFRKINTHYAHLRLKKNKVLQVKDNWDLCKAEGLNYTVDYT